MGLQGPIAILLFGINRDCTSDFRSFVRIFTWPLELRSRAVLGAVHIVRTQQGGRGVYQKRADTCRGICANRPKLIITKEIYVKIT